MGNCDCHDRPAMGLECSTLTGHSVRCPVHQAILSDYQAAVLREAFDDDGPVDRGTPLWVWVNGPQVEFVPSITAVMREVSVPIGWRLVPDRESGVVLVSVFGERLDACQVWGLAAGKMRGFKARTGKE